MELLDKVLKNNEEFIKQSEIDNNGAESEKYVPQDYLAEVYNQCRELYRQNKLLV